MDQTHLNNFGRGPLKDHLSEIISKLTKRFRRRCHLSQLLTDQGTTTTMDEDGPKKLTVSLCDR